MELEVECAERRAQSAERRERNGNGLAMPDAATRAAYCICIIVLVAIVRGRSLFLVSARHRAQIKIAPSIVFTKCGSGGASARNGQFTAQFIQGRVLFGFCFLWAWQNMNSSRGKIAVL